MKVADFFKAQMDVYGARVQAYSVQVDAHAKQYQINLEKFMADMDRKEVFSVYTASNGYYAELPNGDIVVGTTLSEVCEAAQAAAATSALANDSNTESATNWMRFEGHPWTKVR